MSGTHTRDSHQSKDVEKTFKILLFVSAKEPIRPSERSLFLTKEVSAGLTYGYTIGYIICRAFSIATVYPRRP